MFMLFWVGKKKKEKALLLVFVSAAGQNSSFWDIWQSEGTQETLLLLIFLLLFLLLLVFSLSSPDTEQLSVGLRTQLFVEMVNPLCYFTPTFIRVYLDFNHSFCPLHCCWQNKFNGVIQQEPSVDVTSQFFHFNSFLKT